MLVATPPGRQAFNEQPWVPELAMPKSETTTQQPAIDARSLDDHSFRAHLAALGISYAGETRLQPPRPKFDAGVQVALDARHAEEQKASAARAEAFKHDAIDGRSVSPQDIECRLR